MISRHERQFRMLWHELGQRQRDAVNNNENRHTCELRIAFRRNRLGPTCKYFCVLNKNIKTNYGCNPYK